MHRMGQVPINKFGITISSSFERLGPDGEDEDDDDDDDYDDDYDVAHRENTSKKQSTKTMHPSELWHLVKARIPSKDDVINMPFWEKYNKSCSRLWLSMGKVMRSSVDDLPGRTWA
jgi:hypothetical protein